MSHHALRLSIGGLVPRDRGTSFRLFAGLLPYLAARRRRVVLIGLCVDRRQAGQDHAAATAQQTAWQKWQEEKSPVVPGASCT